MTQQPYKKITFQFPSDDFVLLKMACAKQGVSMKDFVTKAVMRSIDEYENYLDVLALKEVTQEDLDNAISLDQLKTDLGFHEEIQG